ncbi:hypothetical protein FF38_04761 [Lucilia cuprina]|uniref:Uncharacterized protein n=1 Tax=Lucilia cuprina TaxID=7375 RepID=A0A0L0CR12_LUCCU|nr:hypothetical protein FF38_04761 [Lucilia cuprina]
MIVLRLGGGIDDGKVFGCSSSSLSSLFIETLAVSGAACDGNDRDDDRNYLKVFQLLPVYSSHNDCDYDCDHDFDHNDHDYHHSDHDYDHDNHDYDHDDHDYDHDDHDYDHDDHYEVLLSVYLKRHHCVGCRGLTSSSTSSTTPSDSLANIGICVPSTTSDKTGVATAGASAGALFSLELFSKGFSVDSKGTTFRGLVVVVSTIFSCSTGFSEKSLYLSRKKMEK